MVLFNKWIDNILIVFIIIMFLDFFSFTRFPELGTIIKNATILVIGVTLMLTSCILIFCSKRIVLVYLDSLIILFVICILLSFFTANIYWKQPFLTSFLSYRYFYVLGIYFIFIYFNISLPRIESLITILFILTIVVFIISYISFPDPLFSNRSEERRGGITILFSGQGFAFLGTFLCLHKYIEYRYVHTLILYFISSSCLFVLTQSRLNLASLMIGSLYIISCSNLNHKVLLIIGVVCLISYLFLGTTLFDPIINESLMQFQNLDDDIRIRSQKYFLFEFQNDFLPKLFGNGYPGEGSRLANEIASAASYGYYTSDVGLTGLYTFFGLFGIIPWILIFILILSVKNSNDFAYTKAYFLTILSTTLTGGSLFDPGYLPSTIVALYLIRKSMIANNLSHHLTHKKLESNL